MYVVIIGEGLLFVGEDVTVAMQVLGANPGSYLKNVSSLKELDNLEDLRNKVEDDEQNPLDLLEDMSEACKKLVTKLERFGLQQTLADRLCSESDKLVGQVRHMGTKGMQTVGENFIALGESIINKSIEIASKKS